MELGCFQTGCSCLAQNTECDAACSCKRPLDAGDAEGCANRAASMRRVLQLGQDVQEIDSWGLDCYTRKNIQDGTAHTGHALLLNTIIGQYVGSIFVYLLRYAQFLLLMAFRATGFTRTSLLQSAIVIYTRSNFHWLPSCVLCMGSLIALPYDLL